MNPMIESSIVERLESLGIFRVVKPYSEISPKSVSSQITPAAYVGFDGYRVDKVNAAATAVNLEERWSVVIVVKSVRQGDGGKTAREDALPLAHACIQALLGFVPELDGSHRPLIPVTAEQPLFDSGFFWLPLAFSRHTIITSKE